MYRLSLPHSDINIWVVTAVAIQLRSATIRQARGTASDPTGGWQRHTLKISLSLSLSSCDPAFSQTMPRLGPACRCEKFGKRGKSAGLRKVVGMGHSLGASDVADVFFAGDSLTDLWLVDWLMAPWQASGLEICMSLSGHC